LLRGHIVFREGECSLGQFWTFDHSLKKFLGSRGPLVDIFFCITDFQIVTSDFCWLFRGLRSGGGHEANRLGMMYCYIDALEFNLY
jgi:hypothetical protein